MECRAASRECEAASSDLAFRVSNRVSGSSDKVSGVKVGAETLLGFPCEISEVQGWDDQAAQWQHLQKLPWRCSSNEERLKGEDTIALALSQSAAFKLGDARRFVCSSLWSQTIDNSVHNHGRSELHRVLGLFTQGGVIGTTKGTDRFPGFTKLLIRIVKECKPNHTFSSLALIRQAEVPPHRDKFNLPNSNILVPLSTPSKGLILWSELKQGDWIMGYPHATLSPKGVPIVGQQQILFTGQVALLDAKRWHATYSNSKGPTLLLVAYTLSSAGKLSNSLRTQLRASGFPLPTENQQGGGSVMTPTTGGVFEELVVGSGGETKKVWVGERGQGNSPNASKPEGCGRDELELACWCSERTCQLCAYKFERSKCQGDESPDESSSWGDSSEGSWFVVQGSEATAKALTCKNEQDDGWEIVAAEIPLRSCCRELSGVESVGARIAQELDDLQLNLKSYLGLERPCFREETGGASVEEAAATAVTLCAITQQVRGLEGHLVQLRSLQEDEGAIQASREIDSPEVLQTRTVPLAEVLEHWEEGWGEAAHSEVASLTVKKQALREP